MTNAEFSQQLGRLVGLPASEFVQHRKPALLLNKLVAIESESAVCEWDVQLDNAFLVPRQGAPAYIGIECMAQCIAVHAGACERVRGFPPALGLLLGTRHYMSELRYFEPGTIYHVSCKSLIHNPDGMGLFECCILSDKNVIVKARLSVLQMPRGTSLNG